jgi:biopolymer transport protein ExbB
MSSFARDPGSITTVVSTWRQLPPSGQVAPVVPLLPLPSQAAANPQTTTATAVTAVLIGISLSGVRGFTKCDHRGQLSVPVRPVRPGQPGAIDETAAVSGAWPMARRLLYRAGQPELDSTPTGDSIMDIQQKLTSFAMMGATWVMWLLIGLSVGGLAVALERAIYLIRTSDNVRRLKAEILRLLRAGDLDAARARLAQSRSVEAQVVAAGLEQDEGSASAEERMGGAAQIAKLRMEKRLAFLGTLGSNAPFIGLLGTVIGIIRAFEELNGAAGKVTAGLMSEIGEALVATAIGILVALPAIAFFNFFQRVIKGRLGRADAFGKEVLAVLKADEGSMRTRDRAMS